MAISKSSEKKLKWGLHDLSPLFKEPSQGTQEVSPPRQPPLEVQFLTVCVPEREGEAFSANASLASQIVRQTGISVSLVSIVPGSRFEASLPDDPHPSSEFLDSRIPRLSLSHQELWRVTGDRSSPTSAQSPALIFLEFEPSEFHSLARIALVLDRVVFLVPARVEGLREAYRWMKGFWNLNRSIEFFLLFREEEWLAQEEEFLFQRFALISSRFLGISVTWLGNLNLTHLILDPLLRTDGSRRSWSPEKSRLWSGLQEKCRIQ